MLVLSLLNRGFSRSAAILRVLKDVAAKYQNTSEAE